MEKTDLMLEYEKIIGKSSIQKITDGLHTVEFGVSSI